MVDAAFRRGISPSSQPSQGDIRQPLTSPGVADGLPFRRNIAPILDLAVRWRGRQGRVENAFWRTCQLLCRAARLPGSTSYERR
jgi:hypothetical protein